MRTEHVEIEDRAIVRRALDRFRAGKADFADYVIGESNSAAGCERTVTFDAALRGTPGFEIL